MQWIPIWCPMLQLLEHSSIEQTWPLGSALQYAGVERDLHHVVSKLIVQYPYLHHDVSKTDCAIPLPAS